MGTTHNASAPQINHKQLQIAKLNANIPPYGHRQGYVPREPADFGDGGSFPEIHIKQYPLDMGRKETQNIASNVMGLRVNDKGEVQYDAILRENMRKEQIMHSKYEDLCPKDEIHDDELCKPSDDITMEQTEETRKALEKIVNVQIQSARPTHTKLKPTAPITVRYQSGTSNSMHASGSTSRLIKIYEMPSDPLDPPKFRHKKLPPRPPSPPVPIMHSPPRNVTIEDQKNWKIPPCVSNWKNTKGFTLPLHQRLAADGRGLYNHVINDKFAKFSESLLIAERQARKEVEARAQMRLKLSKKQKEQKEKELAAMAKAAKDSAKFNTFASVQSDKKHSRDTSEYDVATAKRYKNKRKRGDDDDYSSSESESDSSSVDSEIESAKERRKALAERDRIRKERERENKRQYRLDHKKSGKNKSMRQRERDISERIALGQFSGKKSTESLYDNRLFNQDSGLNQGFEVDDGYNLYDKPLFDSKSKKMYRPTNIDEDIYGIQGGDILNEQSDKMRAHQTFDGAEENRKKGRFEFEKDESLQSENEDELMQELNRYSLTKEKKKKQTIGHHNKGYLYAAGGQSIQNVNEYVAGKRDKVQFVKGDNKKNKNDQMKPGLFYTENAKKEKDKRERNERKIRRRSRSRSRSRKRQRRKNYDNDYDEDRGRWRDGR